MNHPEQQLQVTRRHFLRDCRVGVGKMALGSLLLGESARLATAARPKPGAEPTSIGPHFAPKAKAVIHLFMAGGPSHLELYDYKPALKKYEGRPIPPEVIGGQRFAFIRPESAALGPRFRFARHGESGAELSSVLPHLGRVADDVCFVKSMHTDQFNHAPAQIFLNTGFAQPGRPSLGSWAVYGLGSETKDLPAFIVMSTSEGVSGGTANFSAGFMPSSYSGVLFRNQKYPLLNMSNPSGVTQQLQRDTLDLARELNQEHFASYGDPEITARIRAYEVAYRLQSAAPELIDLRNESQATLDLYGCKPAEPSFARSCLLARRMIERGVRFVNIYHAGWDAHSNVEGNSRSKCGQTDQASAALVQDLKQRGLLDETLVIWGGEFGRTPMVESNPSLGRKLGRDHHPLAFTMWFAGGGMKPGMTYGATDELGFHVVENPVHVHDLQATILHLLGFDHERLTYRFAGRDFRLTDVHGHVVKDILA